MYTLALGASDEPAWGAVGAALAAAGIPGVLVGPRADGPAYRIVGQRRLGRLRELVGGPPEGVPPQAWPPGKHHAWQRQGGAGRRPLLPPARGAAARSSPIPGRRRAPPRAPPGRTRPWSPPPATAATCRAAAPRRRQSTRRGRGRGLGGTSPTASSRCTSSTRTRSSR